LEEKKLEIKLEEGFRIISDAYQFILQKKKVNKKNEEIFDCVSFHPTFETALLSYSRKLFLKSTATTLKEAIEDYKSIEDKIRKISRGEI
jgi:hypothetical protein